jgi:hypothetical protein
LVAVKAGAKAMVCGDTRRISEYSGNVHCRITFSTYYPGFVVWTRLWIQELVINLPLCFVIVVIVLSAQRSAQLEVVKLETDLKSKKTFI